MESDKTSRPFESKEIVDGNDRREVFINSIEHDTKREQPHPPSTEQTELHKNVEQMPEAQPGGPVKPSWESEPHGSLPHLVPATVLEGADDVIARWHAENDSRIQNRTLSESDWRILKGDAGEGHTFADLLSRNEGNKIVPQPDIGIGNQRADFAVKSESEPGKYDEIVDSKAWSLRDAQGRSVGNEMSLRYLQGAPDPERLLNLEQQGGIKDVVNRYSDSPYLASQGKVVIYFPEDVVRWAPQTVERIQGWSGTEVAHGHTVEVRSLGKWNTELSRDATNRLRS